MSYINEAKDLKVTPASDASDDIRVASSSEVKVDDDSHEVFKQADGKVNFRTVSWIRASAIFLKMLFATGILSIPSVMYDLGAFPGAVNLVGWCVINAYGAIILGNFRTLYPQCHSVADMAQLIGGPMLRELVGFMFIVTYVITAASGIIGVSAAFNALSLHSLCTVWFSFIATIIIAGFASVRKFSHIGWLTWVGFVSILAAVLIVVFAAGITASATIFVSSAATSAFLPVISEMRKPKDYPKAVYLCMSFVTSSYLAFALVIYAWCGKWIASPALGSAGTTIKRVAYGIALPGLIVSGSLYVHVAAKYLFPKEPPLRIASWQGNVPFPEKEVSTPVQCVF
ncbi:hypothetical protein CBS147482_4617 [Aspergillus niger]|nr:hypothetical protein CBS147482_4617 [Aspergillus niger]